VKEMLDILLSMTDVDVEVKADPTRFRPSDVKVLICDSTKFRELTGWKNEIPFEQTLRDLLNYWRERV
jgi:GDP-4-dehydro-6-deoxy-D-mannose reductase